MNLFFDIETVLDTTVPEELLVKAREKNEKQFDFLPEYHKILCISVGYIDGNNEKKIKTLTWDEVDIISDFQSMVKANTLIWFNISWFDIPFIVKRGLKYGLMVPSGLKTFGKKPWDMLNIVDLYQVYKMTGYNSASMDAVCKFLDIQSSKDEWIDGSLVQSFHDQWRDQEIYDYCERDVSATIDIYDKFKLLNFI